MTMDDLKK